MHVSPQVRQCALFGAIAFLAATPVAALDLELPRDKLECLVQNREALNSLQSPIVIFAPVFCPDIPLREYDPALLVQNSSAPGATIYIFSKQRISCILDHIETNITSLVRQTGDVLVISFDC